MTPTKTVLFLVTTLALSACGGGFRGGGGADVSLSRNFATGPIYAACLRADRRAADRGLCGCVQASADATLTGGEQSKAVGFFRDPHKAQVVRQSDRASDERFWKRYKEFVAVAERSCR